MTTLPFSPLADREVLDRAAHARKMCGHRCIAVAESGGEFKDYDLDALREYAAEAVAYSESLDVRFGRSS